MTVTTARRVLWISLLLLIPLPFLLSHWGWVPAGRIVQVMLHGLASWIVGNGDNVAWISPLLVLQLLLWLLVLWCVAWAYGQWSANWPVKIRGSIMGLTVLILLIVFSSAPVYRSLLSAEPLPMSFLQVYQ